MAKKQNILVELRSRTLTEGEADDLRAFIVTLKPRVHLTKADWPWLEVRGLSETAATQLVERVRTIAPHCRISGLACPREGVKTRQHASTPTLFRRSKIATTKSPGTVTSAA